MKKLKIKQQNKTDNPEQYNLRLIGLIKKIVADYYDLPFDVYSKNTRKMEIVNVKHTAIFFCKENLKVTTNWLGKKFNVNHSTIIHVKKKFDNLLSWDKVLLQEFEDIQNLVSFKGIAQAQSQNIHNDYYFIDLNNIISVKVEQSKSVVFSGWTENEIKKILKELYWSGTETPEEPLTKVHKNTGLYIMEKKTNNNN